MPDTEHAPLSELSNEELLTQLERRHKDRMKELQQLEESDPEAALNFALQLLNNHIAFLEQLGHEVDHDRINHVLEEVQEVQV